MPYNTSECFQIFEIESCCIKKKTHWYWKLFCQIFVLNVFCLYWWDKCFLFNLSEQWFLKVLFRYSRSFFPQKVSKETHFCCLNPYSYWSRHLKQYPYKGKKLVCSSIRMTFASLFFSRMGSVILSKNEAHLGAPQKRHVDQVNQTALRAFWIAWTLNFRFVMLWSLTIVPPTQKALGLGIIKNLTIQFRFFRSQFDSISIRFNIDLNASISIQ